MKSPRAHRPGFLLLAVGALCAWQPDVPSLANLYREALERREQELGEWHPKVAQSCRDLGLFLSGHGQPGAAQPYLRRALAIDEKTLGADDRITGEDLENLASVLPPDAAIPLLERAGSHKDPEIAARSLATLGSIEERRGEPAHALALYRRALAREKIPLRIAARLNDIALLVEPKAGEPLLRRALAIQEKALGGQHPETAATINNLANVLLAMRHIAQAEPLLRRSLAILEATLGPNHPRTAVSASNLADLLRAKKQYTESRRLYERALSIDERAYGAEHPEVAVDLENLAALLDEMGQGADARKLRERAAAIKAAR